MQTHTIKPRSKIAWDDRRDWCRNLCQVLLWYKEKHPQAAIETNTVAFVLSELDRGRGQVTIKRDRQGFEYRGWMHYAIITTNGLPELNTTYSEELV